MLSQGGGQPAQHLAGVRFKSSLPRISCSCLIMDLLWWHSAWSSARIATADSCAVQAQKEQAQISVQVRQFLREFLARHTCSAATDIKPWGLDNTLLSLPAESPEMPRAGRGKERCPPCPAEGPSSPSQPPTSSPALSRTPAQRPAPPGDRAAKPALPGASEPTPSPRTVRRLPAAHSPAPGRGSQPGPTASSAGPVPPRRRGGPRGGKAPHPERPRYRAEAGPPAEEGRGRRRPPPPRRTASRLRSAPQHGGSPAGSAGEGGCRPKMAAPRRHGDGSPGSGGGRGGPRRGALLAAGSGGVRPGHRGAPVLPAASGRHRAPGDPGPSVSGLANAGTSPGRKAPFVWGGCASPAAQRFCNTGSALCETRLFMALMIETENTQNR